MITKSNEDIAHWIGHTLTTCINYNPNIPDKVLVDKKLFMEEVGKCAHVLSGQFERTVPDEKEIVKQTLRYCLAMLEDI